MDDPLPPTDGGDDLFVGLLVLAVLLTLLAVLFVRGRTALGAPVPSPRPPIPARDEPDPETLEGVVGDRVVTYSPSMVYHCSFEPGGRFRAIEALPDGQSWDSWPWGDIRNPRRYLGTWRLSGSALTIREMTENADGTYGPERVYTYHLTPCGARGLSGWPTLSPVP